MQMPRPDTLAARLALWYAALFVLFSGLAFLVFYLGINSTLNHQLDEDLTDDITEFRQLLATEGQQRLLAELKREALNEDHNEVLIRLFGSDGEPIFTSDMTVWKQSELDKLYSETAGTALQTVAMADGEDAARVIVAPIGDGLTMQIGESMEKKNEFMESLITVFLVAFLLSILAGVITGLAMSRKALAGIDEVSRAAIDVAEGKLDRRVDVQSQDREVRDLVDAFNNMVERIRRLIFGMREMTDNIAHDLRSPLGRIRAGAEQALVNDSSLEDFQKASVETLEECDRLLHMINSTLDVAEAEMGISDMEMQDTDLSQMVLDACELFEPLAEGKEIELNHHIPIGCRIVANTAYLQRLLGNLLENAIKYTPPEGKVTVDLESRDHEIYIKVIDTGAGIAPGDQARIFDRFYRCDTSRSEPGCGLGLSLARAIARAHGGDIQLKSALNHGSEFIVTLPSQG